MEVTFTTNVMNKNDEKIILICLSGVLEALKRNNISIDEAEKFLFSPRIVAKLQEKECNEKIIDIIERGCELEDIASLIPGKLVKTIDELENMVFELMKNYPTFNKTCWIE